MAAMPVAATRPVPADETAAKLVGAAEKRFELKRREDLMALEEEFEYLRRQMGQYKRTNLELGGLR